MGRPSCLLRYSSFYCQMVQGDRCVSLLGSFSLNRFYSADSYKFRRARKPGCFGSDENKPPLPVNEIAQIPVLGYGEDAILSAKLELTTEKRGCLRRADAMIAAVIVNRNAALYTFDRRYRAFQDAGLKLFD